MKRWILPAVALLIAGAIAWPFVFGNSTVEVKGRTFTVEHRTADGGSMSRHTPIRNRAALGKNEAILCSFDRDRYQYYWSDGCKAGFDIAYLDAAGKVLQTGRIRPPAESKSYLDDPGVASESEARHALFLPEGSLENTGLAAGDTAVLSSDLTGAAPPLPTITVGGRAVRVVISETLRERSRGLMHRPRMSKDEGMLFLYPRDASDPNLSFYMRNTLMSLDISYFTGAGKFVNVVSTQRAAKPSEGTSITAPAAGPAQFVLEVPIGWFKENGLADEQGKPAKEIALELPDDIRKRAGKAEAR